MIYGLYVYKLGKMEDPKQRFEEALWLSPDSAEVNYSIGLVMVETGGYFQAKEHTVRAYELGYALHGFRNKLKRVGVWYLRAHEGRSSTTLKERHPREATVPTARLRTRMEQA